MNQATETTTRRGTYKPTWRMTVNSKSVTWVRLDPKTGRPDESTRETR
jgi:hypothetical protein